MNLVGTELHGTKVPRMSGARVLYRDGVPVATLVAGNVEVLATLSTEDERAVRSAVMRDRERWEAPPSFLAPLAAEAGSELSPADRP
jgi:ATP-dependent Lhr-like helicase